MPQELFWRKYCGEIKFKYRYLLNIPYKNFTVHLLSKPLVQIKINNFPNEFGCSISLSVTISGPTENLLAYLKNLVENLPEVMLSCLLFYKPSRQSSCFFLNWIINVIFYFLNSSETLYPQRMASLPVVLGLSSFMEKQNLSLSDFE